MKQKNGTLTTRMTVQMADKWIHEKKLSWQSKSKENQCPLPFKVGKNETV